MSDAARDDDASDFSAFVRSRTPALLRAAYLLTGDQHLAEDLVQSALARTHLSWRRLRDAGNAEAYTRKIMYHMQVSSWRRRRAAESLYAEPPERATHGDPAAGVDLRLAVRAALERLTPRQRAVLVLRRFEDRSEAETAELLNVSLGTVKSQTSHALSRIRTLAPELAAIAGEVQPTDLEPGVRRASRRIARRRTSAAVVAVVVAVVAIATAAAGLRPRVDIPPTVPTPTPSVSATVGPSTLPRPVGTAAAFSCSGGSNQPRPAPATSGRIYFWTWDDNQCARLSLLSGGQVRVLASIPFGSHGPSATVELSPDGTRIAWITDRGEGQPGDLAVVTLGGTPRLIGGQAYNQSGPNPTWEIDSRHVLVSAGDAQYRVDTETGESAPAPTITSYVSYSPNRAFRAYPDDSSVVVTRADGTVMHRVAYAGPEFTCQCGFLIHGVSDDGLRVAVGWRNTDPSRVWSGLAIVDTTTGREVPLTVTPPSGHELSQVVLWPGGGYLTIHMKPDDGTDPRLTFVSATGTITNRVTVPELTGVVALVQP